MKYLSLADFLEELRSLSRRPGLVFGSNLTRTPSALADLFRDIFVKMSMGDLYPAGAAEDDFPHAIDLALLKYPEKYPLLQSTLLDKIRSLKPPLEIAHLVKAGWSAYVSLTEDLILEEALRNYADAIPSSRTVTIVDGVTVEPPSRSFPIYKLLGNAADNSEERSVALSSTQALLRKQLWPILLRTLTDYLRDAPLLVLGADGNIQRLRDLLGLLATQQSPRVTELRFLRGDQALLDPTIELILKKFNVGVIDTNIKDLCESIASIQFGSTAGQQAAAPKSAMRLVQDLCSHYDCPVDVVPVYDVSPLSIPQIELPSCIDGLFRPSAIDWRPFRAGLDLRRNCVPEILKILAAQVQSATPRHPKVLVLVGEAGVGKTTLAKRVAYEASSGKRLVLWCRRLSAGGWLKTFRKWLSELFEALNKNHAREYDELLLVCDDPWGLRIDASDVLVALEKSPIKACLLATMRQSDRHIVELRSTTSSVMGTDAEVEVPFTLESNELERMSEMLVKIGAVTSLERAQNLVKTVPTKDARDILCSLWYLVPETQFQLAESLKDEYFRLGSISTYVSEIAEGATVESGKLAHKAYEFVTVSSKLDIGLPLEVLVHGLKTDYGTWVSSLANGRPLWGLLYDDRSKDGDTIVYFTRNEVVTRVLINLVNGGVSGHTGEVRVLRELIQACDGQASVYRNFLVDVLVRSRYKLEDILSYEQGCDLYEAGLAALPQEDRLLEHHYGIWIQNKGPKDLTAYRQLEKALAASSPSGLDRDAPREHIHASMAAATLQLIREGVHDWSTGSELVRSHLRSAASSTFFNLYTSHVAANLLVEAAQLAAQRNDQLSRDKFTVDAFEEIEKAFHTVGARERSSFQYRKTLGMLGDLQRRILGLIPSVEHLKVVALQLFSKDKNQTGFELAARRMLVEASESNKGRDYNELNEYLNTCMSAIEEASQNPTADLLTVRVDLFIRWKIHGFKDVPWADFRDDLLDILGTRKYADDVLKHFYLAVAHFHLQQLAEASATFAHIRRSGPGAHKPNEIRAYFQDSYGNPRRFQGSMRTINGRSMVSIPELDFDAPLLSRAATASGLVHVYIGFSFNGPVATFEQPVPADMLLH